MQKILKTVSVILLLLTGVNAMVAGFLFIADPGGAKIGLSADYLRYSPFRSFLVPGIILFTVNGLLNLSAAIYVIRQKRNYFLWIGLQGILLGGWILIQVLLVRDLNALHVIMFSIGVVLAACGRYLYKIHKSGAG